MKRSIQDGEIKMANSRKYRRSHGHVQYRVSHERVQNFDDPNEVSDPITPGHLAALAPTCKFLGKVFYDGDTICYDGFEWQCTNGNWEKTGHSCG
jgi:hypothetical protein